MTGEAQAACSMRASAWAVMRASRLRPAPLSGAGASTSAKRACHHWRRVSRAPSSVATPFSGAPGQKDMLRHDVVAVLVHVAHHLGQRGRGADKRGFEPRGHLCFTHAAGELAPARATCLPPRGRQTPAAGGHGPDPLAAGSGVSPRKTTLSGSFNSARKAPRQSPQSAPAGPKPPWPGAAPQPAAGRTGCGQARRARRAQRSSRWTCG